MKTMRIIKLLIFIITLQSCNKEECGECFTPPSEFTFEIIDKKSGENLFTNKTYDYKNLTINNTLENNKPIEFSKSKDNLISIHSIGWKTETVNLRINISDKNLFNFYVESERKSENCCTFTTFKQIKITESDFILDKQTGVYKILIE